jgi:protoporphyrinogen oxidase
MEAHSTVILGAGLTGLSCAYHLGRDYLLVEKENEPGGMVRTRNRQGFLCDGTGHWLHLRTDYAKALITKLLPGRMTEHERKAVIHMHGTFTPYPFQANTFGLPREVVLECLLGLLKARHPEDFGVQPAREAPAHFGEWIERYFGSGIARHFMVPYNEKLLGVTLDQLRPEYAERFIPRPSLEDVVRGALGFSRESLGYNARFLYPREGGIGELPKALAAALNPAPAYGTSISTINLAKRLAGLSDGRQIRFEWLVNTSPLNRFLQQVEDLPGEIRAAGSQLRSTTVHYFDIGVRGPGEVASHYHWIYFPEPEYIFYRVGSYSAVHPGAAPPGCRSYYVEMSGGVSAWLDRPQALRERVLADLRRVRVLSDKDELVFASLSEIPSAYVIFDRNYERCRQLILDFLAEHRVLTAGRWGGWGYGGMEDALLDGQRAAERVRQA